MNVTYRPRPTAEFSMRGIDVSVLADGDQTAGAWEAIHQTVAPGGGSPLHTLGVDKLFVVLGGELVLVVDGVEHLAVAGGSATVPAGVPHRFENRSSAEAHLLVVTTGSGHVDFLRGMAALSASGAPRPDELQAHAAHHHVCLL